MYFKIVNAKCTWEGFGQPIEVKSHRRPLSSCITPLTGNKSHIDKLVEPSPTLEVEQIDPKGFEEMNRFPSYMCIRAIKKP